MSEIILHHYQTSPFARKMRVLMGFKNIHWQSVIIPAVMPKPDVVALTGGYRRTPIMQVGADIFCDTALIGWQLDQYYPNPPLYPTQHAATVRAWEQWADTALFQNAVGLVFQKEVLLKMFNGDIHAKICR